MAKEQEGLTPAERIAHEIQQLELNLHAVESNLEVLMFVPEFLLDARHTVKAMRDQVLVLQAAARGLMVKS